MGHWYRVLIQTGPVPVVDGVYHICRATCRAPETKSILKYNNSSDSDEQCLQIL